MIPRSGGSRLFLLLLGFLAACIAAVSASTPASFCKCTCFSNSTIIQLDSPPLSSSADLLDGAFLGRRDRRDEKKKTTKHRALNCNDCNRKFCLDYNLPVCKGAKEEDVFTTCFQRDSRKDEAVVFIFIFATSGLLAWAALRPWVGKWIEVCTRFLFKARARRRSEMANSRDLVRLLENGGRIFLFPIIPTGIELN
ncbi:hypothetical protein VTN02DRAFT_2912 [Thermoascus thermophilus]